MTKLEVPYGKQLGVNHGYSDDTADKTTIMTFVSKSRPVKDSDGVLYISGQRIDGNFLEGRLDRLRLEQPDWRAYGYDSSF